MGRLFVFALRTVSIAATVVLVAWLAFMFFLPAFAPTKPDFQHLRMFPYPYKGWVFYLTLREYQLTDERFLLAAPVAIVTGGLVRRRRDQANPPGPQPTPRWPGKP